jgi:hypothetical protein
MPVPPATSVEADLFPNGRPTAADVAVVTEQYELMLQTTESLQARRQTLHTFFMSINSVLLAAIGFIGKQSLDTSAVAIGVVLLGLTGAVMSWSWRQQLVLYGTVSASKWEVINQIEEVLPSRPFCAEYKALKRKGYKLSTVPFTEAEGRIPTYFVGLYSILIVLGVLLALKVI